MSKERVRVNTNRDTFAIGSVSPTDGQRSLAVTDVNERGLLRMRTTAAATIMALSGAARRFSVNRPPLHRLTALSVRSLSDKVSFKAAPSSAPDSTGDHLIYTAEHLALKDSLRKVRSHASSG